MISRFPLAFYKLKFKLTIMKKILLVASIAALAACNNSDNAKVESMNKDSSGTTKMDDNMNYPYTADYSHNFEIGSSKNAMTILQLYKDWDNNTLENSKNSFAEMNDSLIFANGQMLTGSRDTVFATASKIRATMGTVKDEVHAWVPMKSTDKNEDWVLVWTREIRTLNGKTDSTELQETWRFDKDGKVNLVYQYAQQPFKMPPPPAAKK
jgi:hypothetical protein